MTEAAMTMQDIETKSPDMDGVAVKAISRVFDAWGLGADSPPKLFSVSDRTWSRMKKGEWTGTLTQDQMTRASALVGIYKGLHLYFSDSLADKWIGLSNTGPLFLGKRPLDFMIQGGIPAMLNTREYVDAIRGGL